MPQKANLMNPSEVLRIVDAIHRDKNIEKEIVFEGIEAALVSAAKKHYGEEAEIEVRIDRDAGTITASCDGEPLDSEETVGRIGAQTAKQVMIQKIREAERDALHDEYSELIGEMVSGIIQRYEGGAATVSLTNVEAILPRSERIPGETHHVNERVRTTVFEVRKSGSRVKVILSRARPQLVQRLFEQEIPEIIDGIIEVRAMSREPGYRSKVAVSSSDQRVDCVGACVGVRGNRIKNIVDELAGERIDIVRWDDNLEIFIPNALQPAEVEQVILCKMLGRAIVLVREDQLSLAIGRRGQNVRLASKLSGWDIEIMTQEELAESIHWEAEQYIPFDIQDVQLDYEVVEGGATAGNMDVLLVAVKKDKISEYTSAIQQAGRNPTIVDVDVFALQNCYEINYVPDPGRVVALLNIGASTMNVNVVRDGSLVFNRDIAVGGNQYTDAIQKDLNLSFEQAESLKHGEQVEGASPESLEPILQGVSENITTEIQSRPLGNLPTPAVDRWGVSRRRDQFQYV